MKLSLPSIALALFSLPGLVRGDFLRGVQRTHRDLQTLITETLDFEVGNVIIDIVPNLLEVTTAIEGTSFLGVNLYKELGYEVAITYRLLVNKTIDASDAIIRRDGPTNALTNALQVEWCDASSPVSDSNPSCVLRITVERADGTPFKLTQYEVGVNAVTCNGDADDEELIKVQGGLMELALVPPVDADDSLTVNTDFDKFVTSYVFEPLVQRAGCFSLLDLTVQRVGVASTGTDSTLADDPDIPTLPANFTISGSSAGTFAALGSNNGRINSFNYQQVNGTVTTNSFTVTAGQRSTGRFVFRGALDFESIGGDGIVQFNGTGVATGGPSPGTQPFILAVDQVNDLVELTIGDPAFIDSGVIPANL